MDELMQKITEKLNIAIDKAPEVYEMLKWQNATYETCSTMITYLTMLGVLVGMFTFVALMVLGGSNDATLVEVIAVIIPIIFIVVLIIGLYIYRNTHAPDVLFLKTMIK
nr:MAG TPA: Immune evasion protein [Caudoviricetes sp.]